MHLHSVGACEIEIAGNRITAATGRLFGLSLLLIMERRAIDRSEAAELLWTDADRRKGSHRLRQLLYRIRQFGEEVQSTRSTIQAPLGSDADYFALLQDVEANYEVGGRFLPGYDPGYSAEFTSWLERHRNIVHAAIRRRLVKAITSAKKFGQWEKAELLAIRCLEIDCLNEEATLALAEASAMSGSKARALTILDNYLKEIGPSAREIRLPAVALRNRIARSDPLTTRLGRVIPFVGRKDYLARLNSALGLATGSRGSLQLVWGEPGIGKTRLVREFLESARLRTAQVQTIHIQSSDQQRPLSCFLDLLPSLMSLRGALGCSPATLRTLQLLTDTHPSTALQQVTQPEITSAINRHAILDILEAIAEEQCLVLVFEDLQWSDRLSLAFLRDLTSWIASRSILIVGTSRTRDIVVDWKQYGIYGATELQVLPLRDDESRELLSAVHTQLGIMSDEGTASWYIDASAGNPYHLTELIYRRSHQADPADIEASLSTLIQQRFQHLPPQAIRVLQAAALLGTLSTLKRVRDVLGIASADIFDAFDELERQGLIEVVHHTVRCKHDLIASAASSQLSEGSRRLFHCSIASVLESECVSAVSAQHLWEIADHWLSAGEHVRAIQRLRDCALHAMRIGSPSEAAHLLRRAVSLPQSVESRRELLTDYITILERGSLWTDLVAALQEGSLLQPTRREVQHDHQEWLLLESKRRCGLDPSEVLARLRRCVTESGDPLHRVRAGCTAVKLADNLCDASAAHDFFAAVRTDLDNVDVPRDLCLELSLIYHCSFGDPELSAIAARELVTYCRDSDDELRLISALVHATYSLRAAGYVSEAVKAGLEAYDRAATRSVAVAAIMAADELSDLRMLEGSTNEAVRWQERACEWAQRSPGSAASAGAWLQGARMAAFGGMFDRGEELLAKVDESICLDDLLRGRANFMTNRILIQLWRDKRPLSDERLRTFLELYDAVKSFNQQDYVALAAYEALIAGQRPIEARGLVKDYLTHHRRERCPVLPALRSALSSAVPAVLR